MIKLQKKATMLQKKTSFLRNKGGLYGSNCSRSNYYGLNFIRR